MVLIASNVDTKNTKTNTHIKFMSKLMIFSLMCIITRTQAIDTENETGDKK